MFFVLLDFFGFYFPFILHSVIFVHLKFQMKKKNAFVLKSKSSVLFVN